MARIRASPGLCCLLTFLADVLLFGLGYGGALGKGTLAIIATFTLALYLIALVSYVSRFRSRIDTLPTFDSLLEVVALIGILIAGFFITGMFYMSWDWVI